MGETVLSCSPIPPTLPARVSVEWPIMDDRELWRELGQQFRVDSVRCAAEANSGHPTPAIPWVDVATGSLGQGLPIGVGMGIAGKYLDRLPYRVWVLCGDSEMAEGSMWEAFEHAAHYELDNVIAVIDVNRLGQRGETMGGWDIDRHATRARAFGWHTIEIDGHDVDEIDRAYT